LHAVAPLTGSSQKKPPLVWCSCGGGSSCSSPVACMVS